MSTLLMGMLAETFVHVGSEQSDGVVDLPVAREAISNYPFIPGSGLKGALLDWAKQQSVPDRESLFGQQESAGQLLFSDARLLALPVRSQHQASRWITCPRLLERYHRDRQRLGVGTFGLSASPEPAHALGTSNTHIILEERGFDISGAVAPDIIDAIATLVPHEATRKRLAESLLLLHDDDFVWFARYGLAVQARNVLDRETKTSKNLWYEESLPPDSLLYCVIGERQTGVANALTEALKARPYLQVGGNETIGQGWFALGFPESHA